VEAFLEYFRAIIDLPVVGKLIRPDLEGSGRSRAARGHGRRLGDVARRPVGPTANSAFEPVF
jgi:hypothetical protein